MTPKTPREGREQRNEYRLGVCPHGIYRDTRCFNCDPETPREAGRQETALMPEQALVHLTRPCHLGRVGFGVFGKAVVTRIVGVDDHANLTGSRTHLRDEPVGVHVLGKGQKAVRDHTVNDFPKVGLLVGRHARSIA